MHTVWVCIPTYSSQILLPLVKQEFQLSIHNLHVLVEY